MLAGSWGGREEQEKGGKLNWVKFPLPDSCHIWGNIDLEFLHSLKSCNGLCPVIYSDTLLSKKLLLIIYWNLV